MPLAYYLPSCLQALSEADVMVTLFSQTHRGSWVQECACHWPQGDSEQERLLHPTASSSHTQPCPLPDSLTTAAAIGRQLSVASPEASGDWLA